MLQARICTREMLALALALALAPAIGEAGELTLIVDSTADVADLAPGELSGRPEKPQDGKTQGGFTATGLAHQAHDFPLF